MILITSYEMMIDNVCTVITMVPLVAQVQGMLQELNIILFLAQANDWCVGKD